MTERLYYTDPYLVEFDAHVIRVEPHAYTGPEGHYLVYLAPVVRMFAVVFETDGTRVTTYRAGRQPEVMYVEGCA